MGRSPLKVFPKSDLFRKAWRVKPCCKYQWKTWCLFLAFPTLLREYLENPLPFHRLWAHPAFVLSFSEYFVESRQDQSCRPPSSSALVVWSCGDALLTDRRSLLSAWLRVIRFLMRSPFWGKFVVSFIPGRWPRANFCVDRGCHTGSDHPPTAASRQPGWHEATLSGHPHMGDLPMGSDRAE